jgi:hypothetical protein
MLRCWRLDNPLARPTFAELKDFFREVLPPGSEEEQHQVAKVRQMVSMPRNQALNRIKMLKFCVGGSI